MFDRTSYEDLFRSLPNRRHPLAAWQQFIPSRQNNTRPRQSTRVEKPVSRTTSPQRQGLARRKTTHQSQRPVVQHLTPPLLEHNLVESHTRNQTFPVNRPASWHPNSWQPMYSPQDTDHLTVPDNRIFMSQYASPEPAFSFQTSPSGLPSDCMPFEPVNQSFNATNYTQTTNTTPYDWNPYLYYQQPLHTQPTNSLLYEVNPYSAPHSKIDSNSLPPSVGDKHLIANDSTVGAEAEIDGDDLVGMGLYESPERTITLSSSRKFQDSSKSGKGLKLEEAWEPISTDKAESDDEDEAEGEDDTELESLMADDSSQRYPSFDQERIPSFDASLDYTTLPTQVPVAHGVPTNLTDYSFYFENPDSGSNQEWFSDFQKVPTATETQHLPYYNWI